MQQAIDDCAESHPLLSRLHVAMGIGYSLKAQGTKLQVDRYSLHKKALDAFKRLTQWINLVHVPFPCVSCLGDI